MKRVVGAILIAVVLWLTGWQDRVDGSDGTTHHGLVVEQEDDRVVLERDGVRSTIPIGEVRRGLKGAFLALARAPGWAFAGVLALLFSLALMQVRWGVFFRASFPATPWRTIFSLGWLGLFFNQVIPAGQVGGDLVKIYAVARDHPREKVQAIVSVFAERGIGLFVMCAGSLGVFLVPADGRIALAKGVATAGLAISVAFLALIALPPIMRWGRILAAFGSYGRRPLLILRSVLVGAAVHATYLVFFFCLGRAMGIELSAFALLVAIPVAHMAGTLPGLPAGWGVGDLAFFFFLPEAGVPAGMAVTMSFCYRSLTMLAALPGGLLIGRPQSQPGQ